MKPQPSGAAFFQGGRGVDLRHAGDVEVVDVEIAEGKLDAITLAMNPERDVLRSFTIMSHHVGEEFLDDKIYREPHRSGHAHGVPSLGQKLENVVEGIDPPGERMLHGVV